MNRQSVNYLFDTTHKYLVPFFSVHYLSMSSSDEMSVSSDSGGESNNSDCSSSYKSNKSDCFSSCDEMSESSYNGEEPNDSDYDDTNERFCNWYVNY